MIDSDGYLKNVYRYIYQNPVRAHISMDCFSYPYSSLYFSGDEKKRLNYDPHYDYEKQKVWFERRLGQDYDDIIRVSLKKAKFKPNVDISTFHKNCLNNVNY